MLVFGQVLISTHFPLFKGPSATHFCEDAQTAAKPRRLAFPRKGHRFNGCRFSSILPFLESFRFVACHCWLSGWSPHVPSPHPPSNERLVGPLCAPISALSPSPDRTALAMHCHLPYWPASEAQHPRSIEWCMQKSLHTGISWPVSVFIFPERDVTTVHKSFDFAVCFKSS